MRLRMYAAAVFSIMVYGSEVWLDYYSPPSFYMEPFLNTTWGDIKWKKIILIGPSERLHSVTYNLGGPKNPREMFFEFLCCPGTRVNSKDWSVATQFALNSALEPRQTSQFHHEFISDQSEASKRAVTKPSWNAWTDQSESSTLHRLHAEAQVRKFEDQRRWLAHFVKAQARFADGGGEGKEASKTARN